jgi:hypothetical protein
MEARVRRFQELHANKWFHNMNWVLDEMKITCLTDKIMHIKYAGIFYL